MDSTFANASGIYSITNTVNGKMYVGSAARFSKRWGQHRGLLRRGKHHSVILQRAWDKHGEGAFEFKVLLVCSRENLIFYEQRCLDGLGPEYNVAKNARAPTQGRPLSAATLAKISAANKGRVRSPESRAYMALLARQRMAAPGKRKAVSEALTGKVLSEETRIKISVALTGRPKSPQHAENIRNAQRGRTSKPESVEKMRAALTGRSLSAKHKRAIGAGVRSAAVRREAAKRLFRLEPAGCVCGA